MATDNQNELAKNLAKRLCDIDDERLDVRHHLPNWSISIDEYTKARLVEYGGYIRKKHRIYLDQNYWIYLRDAKNGRARDPRHRIIYELLSGLTATKRVICPVSFSHWCETLRQSDGDSRIRTAEIMDELCGGCALVPSSNLSDIEMVSFVMKSCMPTLDYLDNIDLSWIYSGHIAGLLHWTGTQFDKKTELALQKSLFEKRRYIGLVDSMQMRNAASTPPMMESDDAFQRQQTEICARHRKDFNTFHEFYDNEIHGCVDLHRDAIAHALARVHFLSTGSPKNAATELAFNATSHYIEKLIVVCFRDGKATNQLPCLDIPASIHALKRYRNAPFQKGDLHDMIHARTALPYCNYFFTERRMGQLLCDEQIALDKKYGCTIAWDENTVIATLESLRCAL